MAPPARTPNRPAIVQPGTARHRYRHQRGGVALFVDVAVRVVPQPIGAGTSRQYRFPKGMPADCAAATVSAAEDAIVASGLLDATWDVQVRRHLPGRTTPAACATAVTEAVAQAVATAERRSTAA